MLRRLFGQPMIRLAGLSFLLLVVAFLWWWLPTVPQASWQMPWKIYDLQLSADGQTMALTHDDGLTFWDLAAGRERATIPAQSHTVPDRPVRLSPDGRAVAYYDPAESTRLQLWSEASQHSAPLPEASGALAFSPDSRRLVTATEKDVSVWDVATVEKVGNPWKEKPLYTIAHIDDGRVFGVSSEREDEGLTIWDLTAPAHLRDLPEARFPVFCSCNGKFAATSSARGVVLWDLESAKDLAVIPKTDIYPLEVSPDGTQLITGPGPRLGPLLADAKVWDLSSLPPRERGVLEESERVATQAKGQGFTEFRFSADGKWIAGRAELRLTGYWYIWDASSLKCLPLGPITSPPEFAADGRTVAGVIDSGPPTFLQKWLKLPGFRDQVMIWDLTTGGRELAVLQDCSNFAYLPDGKSLLTTGRDGRVQLWDVPPRRAMWVEYGLPAIFVLLLSSVCWYCLRLRRKVKPAPDGAM